MTEKTITEQFSFADLGLRPELLDALAEVGYEEPTAISARRSSLLEGRDLLGRAVTGTGKTAAFSCRSCTGCRTATAGTLPRRSSWCPPGAGRNIGSTPPPTPPEGTHPPHLRRPAHRPPVAGPGTRCRRRRRHPGTGPRPPRRGTLVLDTVRAVVLDETDGCSTWASPKTSGDHRRSAGEPPDSAVLGNHADRIEGIARRPHRPGARTHRALLRTGRAESQRTPHRGPPLQTAAWDASSLDPHRGPRVLPHP